jgi:hypothetical protein
MDTPQLTNARVRASPQLDCFLRSPGVTQEFQKFACDCKHWGVGTGRSDSDGPVLSPSGGQGLCVRRDGLWQMPQDHIPLFLWRVMLGGVQQKPISGADGHCLLTEWGLSPPRHHPGLVPPHLVAGRSCPPRTWSHAKCGRSFICLGWGHVPYVYADWGCWRFRHHHVPPRPPWVARG